MKCAESELIPAIAVLKSWKWNMSTLLQKSSWLWRKQSKNCGRTRIYFWDVSVFLRRGKPNFSLIKLKARQPKNACLKWSRVFLVLWNVMTAFKRADQNVHIIVVMLWREPKFRSNKIKVIKQRDLVVSIKTKAYADKNICYVSSGKHLQNAEKYLFHFFYRSHHSYCRAKLFSSRDLAKTIHVFWFNTPLTALILLNSLSTSYLEEPGHLVHISSTYDQPSVWGWHRVESTRAWIMRLSGPYKKQFPIFRIKKHHWSFHETLHKNPPDLKLSKDFYSWPATWKAQLTGHHPRKKKEAIRFSIKFTVYWKDNNKLYGLSVGQCFAFLLILYLSTAGDKCILMPRRGSLRPFSTVAHRRHWTAMIAWAHQSTTPFGGWQTTRCGWVEVSLNAILPSSFRNGPHNVNIDRCRRASRGSWDD